MKPGRHKKEILEEADLEAWNNFLHAIEENARLLGDSLTDKEKKFLSEFDVYETDSVFDKTVKALKFKHYILHKPLTQDECTYFISINKKGAKPTEKRRLTKMAICKIERDACLKLRKALGDRFNIFELGDVCNLSKHRISAEEMTMDSKPLNGFAISEKEYTVRK